MQNKRQEQLLAILSERRDWMTSRQLAGLLQVSDRTIRSDVEAINKHTDPPPIESNVRQGYRLCGDAQITYNVEVFRIKQRSQQVTVCDIAFHKTIVGI